MMPFLKGETGLLRNREKWGARRQDTAPEEAAVWRVHSPGRWHAEIKSTYRSADSPGLGP